MRIALISYEYPPDTAFGGIGTYTQQWAKLLKERGHDVEVFCASGIRAGTEIEEGIPVHRVKEVDRINFKFSVVEIFKQRHEWKAFGFCESPEFNADGKIVKTQFPEVKLVVKLHTPSFLMNELNDLQKRVNLIQKLRTIVGAYRRFQKPVKYWKAHEDVYKDEKEITTLADFITSPSQSLRFIVARKWKIPVNKIVHLPNPYLPGNAYLSIQSQQNLNTVTYFGRLEKRKGVLLFKKIIPLVLQKKPATIFRFIGGDTIVYPQNQSCKYILQKALSQYSKQIEFIDHVPLDEIPKYLSLATVCVYPSLWENFPTVCLEAMSAGCAIVGSKNGGMKDMLENPKAGILVDPENPEEIADAVCYLLDYPDERKKLSIQARKNVLEKYNAETLGSLFEKMLNVS